MKCEVAKIGFVKSWRQIAHVLPGPIIAIRKLRRDLCAEKQNLCVVPSCETILSIVPFIFSSFRSLPPPEEIANAPVPATPLSPLPLPPSAALRAKPSPSRRLITNPRLRMPNIMKIRRQPIQRMLINIFLDARRNQLIGRHIRAKAEQPRSLGGRIIALDTPMRIIAFIKTRHSCMNLPPESVVGIHLLDRRRKKIRNFDLEMVPSPTFPSLHVTPFGVLGNGRIKTHQRPISKQVTVGQSCHRPILSHRLLESLQGRVRFPQPHGMFTSCRHHRHLNHNREHDLHAEETNPFLYRKKLLNPVQKPSPAFLTYFLLSCFPVKILPLKNSVNLVLIPFIPSKILP